VLNYFCFAQIGREKEIIIPLNFGNLAARKKLLMKILVIRH